MTERDWATLIGFLVFAGLRVLDYLLPRGRHLKMIHRFSVPDDDPPAHHKDGKE